MAAACVQTRAKETVLDFLFWLDTRKVQTEQEAERYEKAMRALNNELCFPHYDRPIAPYVAEKVKHSRPLPIARAKLCMWRYSARCLQWMAGQSQVDITQADMATALETDESHIYDAMIRSRRYGLVTSNVIYTGSRSRCLSWSITELGRLTARKLRWNGEKPYLVD